MPSEKPASDSGIIAAPGAIRRVLVGLDGSQLAESALPHAVAMARTFATDLCLLRVIERREAPGRPVDTLAWRLFRAEAESYLRGHVERLADRGLAVRGEVTEGDAACEILDFAERGDFGLLVLGSHGEGGPSPFTLSGTVHKVIARAGRSTLLVRSLRGSPPSADDEPIYLRIVVPVDGSQRAEWALCQAAAVARHQGAELVLLAVAPVPETFRRPPLEPRTQRLVDEIAGLNRRWAEEYVTKMKRRLAAPGLEVRTRVSSSSRVRHEVDTQLRAMDADLVVVSAHGAAGGAHWPFGSTSSHLIHHGTAPLLVLQDQLDETIEPAETAPVRDDSRRPRRGG
jgi:nucleotide-binding universal stress UspA family protein